MIRRLRLAAGALSFGLAAAVSAALLAHVAIDALGDVALVRDAYDGLAHDSRGLMALVLLAGCGVLAVRFVLAALEGVAGRERVGRALCLPPAPMFVVGVMAGAAVALAGMELLDNLVATGTVGSIADAFGGSLAFGLALVAGIAAVIGWSAHSALRWLLQWHGDLLRAIAAAFAPGVVTVRAQALAVAYGDAAAPPSALLLRRAAKRGPPLSLFA